MMEKNKFKKNEDIRISPELAELIGIQLGDGALYVDRNYNYTINYSGCLANDRQYFKHITNLYFNLFGIEPHCYIQKNRNSIELRIRSKAIYHFLVNNLHIPSGKKESLRIPSYLWENKILLSYFIRGIFDTDGCVTFQRFNKYCYKLVKICTKHESFAVDIKNALGLLGIHSFICGKKSYRNEVLCRGYDIVMRGKNADIFFNVIGSSNERKKLIYKKSGDAGTFNVQERPVTF